jgi:hypothetical protein
MSFAHDPSRSKERVLNDECYFPHFLPLTRPLRALIPPQVTSRTALYLARRHPLSMFHPTAPGSTVKSNMIRWPVFYAHTWISPAPSTLPSDLMVPYHFAVFFCLEEYNL